MREALQQRKAMGVQNNSNGKTGNRRGRTSRTMSTIRAASVSDGYRPALRAAYASIAFDWLKYSPPISNTGSCPAGSLGFSAPKAAYKRKNQKHSPHKQRHRSIDSRPSNKTIMDTAQTDRIHGRHAIAENNNYLFN